ncbi:DUF6516 family protein [Geminocystis sp.]|uniref:toxin-antitoxin system TumE family protein n=1 Tax=Geminocystis sp. TaxID=2664100 RepID=UPI0035945DAF
MLLNNYQANYQAIIQKYVTGGWILSFTFSVNTKSSYLGFIQGKLDFIDGSFLFFKKYIDLQEFVNKFSYSFHYQDSENNLIFRYDNAKHKPDLGYRDHKHINNNVIPSKIPDIEQVILEIIREYLNN